MGYAHGFIHGLRPLAIALLCLGGLLSIMVTLPYPFVVDLDEGTVLVSRMHVSFQVYLLSMRIAILSCIAMVPFGGRSCPRIIFAISLCGVALSVVVAAILRSNDFGAFCDVMLGGRR